MGHVADENVLRHRQVRHDLRFLVDDADAGGMAVARLVEDDRRAAMADDAAVRLEHAFEDAHHRRLAGAVLADQRQQLAGAERQRHVVQRLHDAEPLRDMLERKEFGLRQNQLQPPVCFSRRRGRRDRPRRVASVQAYLQSFAL